jgi:hypothetical protein
MKPIILQGSRILFVVSIVVLIITIIASYVAIPVYTGPLQTQSDYRLVTLLSALANGLNNAALPFFGACVLFHFERWKGRGE